MKKNWWKSLLAAAAIYIALLVVVPGLVVSKTIVDQLHSPVHVKGWEADGLILADGRKIPLPGCRKLPQNSLALSDGISRGVELAPDGQVYGLVKVWHWCGNDPVRKHLARINLTEMLTYLREGEMEWSADEDLTATRKGGSFTEHGWRYGDFLYFERVHNEVKFTNVNRQSQ